LVRTTTATSFGRLRTDEILSRRESYNETGLEGESYASCGVITPDGAVSVVVPGH